MLRQCIITSNYEKNVLYFNKISEILSKKQFQVSGFIEKQQSELNKFKRTEKFFMILKFYMQVLSNTIKEL